MAFNTEPYPSDQHGWAELLSERKPARSLQGDHRVSWAVVGAAIADYASGETSQVVSDCLASVPGKIMPPRPLLDIAAYFIVRSRFKDVGLDR